MNVEWKRFAMTNGRYAKECEKKMELVIEVDENHGIASPLRLQRNYQSDQKWYFKLAIK